MKQVFLTAIAFASGVAVVGGSFAFWGNTEVRDAIDSNDYAAFVATAPAPMLERVDSEEVFTDLVMTYEERKAQRAEMKILMNTHQEEVLAAVAADDFTAFQTAHDKMYQAKDAFIDAFRPNDGPNGERPILSEEMLQEHFDVLVMYYEEHGELPRGMKDHTEGMHMGRHHAQGGMAMYRGGDGEKWMRGRGQH